MKLRYKSMIFIFLLLGGASIYAANRANNAFPHEEFNSWSTKPEEAFAKGSVNFDSVKKELLKNYYDKSISEDELYRAAIRGMLKFVDPKMSEWNTLYSPGEFAELSSDLEGEIFGVGIQVGYNEVTGYSFVVDTVPGSPSRKAGIKSGDEILKVDGKSFKKLGIRELVNAIRGKEGTGVTLTVLHEESIKEFKLKRDKIKLESVKLTMLEEGVGQLTVGPFTTRSASALKELVGTFKEKGVKSLVVDLRGNDGGLFESSLEVIRLFVPKGKPIVQMLKRNNAKEEILGNENQIIKDIPIVVLIDGETKSAGEIMAAALAMSYGATTVGENTFGKWSMQAIDELPNKYAIRYTVATLLPPSGEDLTGKGIKPDIYVSLKEEAKAQGKEMLKKPNHAEPRMNEDVQLEAALKILKMSRK